MKDAAQVCHVFVPLAQESFPWAYRDEYQDKQRHQARFEAISCVAITFMHAFKAEPLMCQAVHDALFDRFDMALREQGVGDIAMSHRMKKYAAAFAGRLQNYTALMAQGDTNGLSAAIEKNTGFSSKEATVMADQMMAWLATWQSYEDSEIFLSAYAQKEQEKVAS